MIELVGFPLIWLQTLGMYSPIMGSSGSISRYLSNLILNSSIPMLVRFLIFWGSELNNFGAWTWKLASLIELVKVPQYIILVFEEHAHLCISKKSFNAFSIPQWHLHPLDQQSPGQLLRSLSPEQQCPPWLQKTLPLPYLLQHTSAQKLSWHTSSQTCGQA